MPAIAIIAPDGNSIVSLRADVPLPGLLRAAHGDPRVTRGAVLSAGDWPFAFDRVYVCRPSGWRGFRPDDLPARYWLPRHNSAIHHYPPVTPSHP